MNSMIVEYDLHQEILGKRFDDDYSDHSDQCNIECFIKMNLFDEMKENGVFQSDRFISLSELNFWGTLCSHSLLCLSTSMNIVQRGILSHSKC